MTPPSLQTDRQVDARPAKRRRRRALGRSADRNAPRLTAKERATLDQLLGDKYEYMNHDLFDLPADQAQQIIFDQAPPIQAPDTRWYRPTMAGRLSRGPLTKPVGSAVLSAKQEQALFLQYNYCRFRVCVERDRMQLEPAVDPGDGRALLTWYHKAQQYRDQIAQTNLALVLAMAKRMRLAEMDFADLVSEGNMALLRAVDKFDVARGFKFSTYACRAILKAFSRQGAKLSKYRAMFPIVFDPQYEKSSHTADKRAQHEADCVEVIRSILSQNQADLSDIEQAVLKHRFALGETDDRPGGAQGDTPRPLTLERVGQIVGVSKERVRQIQNKALAKLRVNLEEIFL